MQGTLVFTSKYIVVADNEGDKPFAIHARDGEGSAVALLVDESDLRRLVSMANDLLSDPIEAYLNRIPAKR